MIQSKKEYKYYLSQDRKALKIPLKLSLIERIKYLLFPNYIWNFEKLLRKTEYLNNVKSRDVFFRRIRLIICRAKLRKMQLKLSFSIPINVFGPGLSIAHYGTIVVNNNAKVGANCRIHACVNIGASAGKSEAPTIGNNVYIGPGAILFGNIQIADNITIGANSTVNKSFEKQNVVIAGTPATIVKENYPNWTEFNQL